MSTHITELTSGAKNESNAAQARAAVKAFRSMQPGLSAFARALTGKRSVRVELASGPPRTDGNKIFYRPPIALGLDVRHDRSLCDKRDSLTLLMMCRACALREEVLINIYHEIAHIAFGSFKSTDEIDKVNAIKLALEEYKGNYGDMIRKKVSEASPMRKDSYLGLSGLVSEYLPFIVNVLEDLRIEASMFHARKGTRKMFTASITQIMVNGIEEENGEYSKWNSFPLNHQVVGGMYVMASGIDYAENFIPEVVAALDDPILQGLCKEAVDAKSARDTYLLGFPVLARLRELGFCKLPDESEEAEKPNEETSQDESEKEPDEQKPDEQDSDEQDSDEQDSDEQDSDEQDSDEQDSDEQGEEGSNDEDSDSNGNNSQDSDNEGDDHGDTGLGGSGGSGEPESGGSPDGEDDSTGAEHNGIPEEDSDSSPRDPGEQGGATEPNNTGDGDGAPGAGKSGLNETDQGLREEDDTDSKGNQDSNSGDSDDNSEAVDSGADEGKGGQALENNPLGMGTTEGLSGKINVFANHEHIHEAVADAINHTHNSDTDKTDEELAIDKALDIAIIQGLYFETPSLRVRDVRIFEYENQDKYTGGNAWAGISKLYGFSQNDSESRGRLLGIDCDMDIPESVLGPATLQTRRTFDENRRAKNERNLKSGKIRSQALGRRAWSGDERLFQKKTQPGKRSYSVLIGIDISGSTIGVNIALAKRAAMAQAELCHRANVDFALWCHTTDITFNHDSTITMDMYKIKDFNQSWSSTTKEHLAKIGSAGGNLDGHSIEFYRKEIEKQNATDKIILYYSDGKMPAANHEEELEILQREIKYCRQHGISLMGVGIRTDSPRRHGLDTFQVDSDKDLIGVTRHLEKKFLSNR